MLKNITYAILLVCFLLLFGTVFYHATENWSYVDSFYFSTMTLTTIGYGDLVPTTTFTKIFTSFYVIIGVGAMLYMLSYAVAGYMIKEHPFHKLLNLVGKLRHHEKEIKKLKKEIKTKEPKKDIRKLKKEIKKK